MRTGMISNHFSWYEVEHSDTAARNWIDNSLPQELVGAAENTARELEVVRMILGGRPLKINSWYRCPELQLLPQFHNPHSQHPKAEAVDFVCPRYGDSLQIAREVILNRAAIPFDQLILEHTWVHISFCSIPSAIPRGQILSLLKSGGYANGLTDSEGKPL